jgi:Holliday junction DNA helicase RuvA
MIGRLRGTVVSLTPEVAILDVGGVGYELHIPTSTYYQLEPRRDEEVVLHVHTHVREDSLVLFGFSTRGERRLFERLIAVSGIGPKLGRVILSGMEPADLLAALSREDAGRLATIPGVGKKTAERLVLELKDKVAGLVEETAMAVPRAATAVEDDVVGALVNLGYRERDAAAAARAVVEDEPEAPFADRLRWALKRLARL